MRIRLLTAVLYSDWWTHCFGLLGLFALYSTDTDSGSSSKESYNCITFFLWRSYFFQLCPHPQSQYNLCMLYLNSYTKWTNIWNKNIALFKPCLFAFITYSRFFTFPSSPLKIFWLPFLLISLQPYQTDSTVSPAWLMSCRSSLDMPAAPSGVNIADTRGLTQFTDTTVKTSFTSLVGLNSASRTADHNPQGAMLPSKLQGLVWWRSTLYFFFFFFPPEIQCFCKLVSNAYR